MLGLVGFGRIPQLVAPKAKSFGMRVIAYDPFVPAEVFRDAGVESVSFDELLRISDYVSIHSPLMPETKGLFNAATFRQMKPTAYVVNTARGPIVDEAALAAALDAEQIAGAALDVMTQEPPGKLAALRPRQRDPHAAHELLFRGVARRAADQGRRGSSGRPQREGAAQPGEPGSPAKDNA